MAVSCPACRCAAVCAPGGMSTRCMQMAREPALREEMPSK